jgi:hypothetical protein
MTAVASSSVSKALDFKDPRAICLASESVYSVLKPIFESCHASLASKGLQGRVDLLLDKEAVHAGCNLFIRDARVRLSDGTHLIPYPLEMNVISEMKLRALLPITMKESMLNTKMAVYGRGFCQETLKEAVSFATKHEIPYRYADSCIEGGNCFIFSDHEDKQRAIVGLASVASTYVALESRGFFEKFSSLIDEALLMAVRPDAEIFRMAKNLEMIAPLLAFESDILAGEEESKVLTKISAHLLAKYSDVDDIYKDFARPATAAEMAGLIETVKVFQVKWHIAMAVIACDLGLDVDSILFIEQSMMHIDYELAVTADKTILMHDDRLSRQVLEAWKPDDSLTGLKDSYLASIDSKTQNLKRVIFNQKAFLDKGLKCHLVPGVYGNIGSSSFLNFMNGISLKDGTGHTFITLDSEIEALSMAFQEALGSSGGKVTLNLIEKAFMRIFMTEKRGGLHCLSLEI